MNENLIPKDPISYCIDFVKQLTSDWRLYKKVMNECEEDPKIGIWVYAMIKQHIIRWTICNINGHQWENESEEDVKAFVCERCGLLVIDEECEKFEL